VTRHHPDITDQLELAIAAIAGDDDGIGVPPYDAVVLKDDGVTIFVSDVLASALVTIRRLRAGEHG
jgi:hypothetical protein